MQLGIEFTLLRVAKTPRDDESRIFAIKDSAQQRCWDTEEDDAAITLNAL